MKAAEARMCAYHSDKLTREVFNEKIKRAAESGLLHIEEAIDNLSTSVLFDLIHNLELDGYTVQLIEPMKEKILVSWS